VAGDDDVYAACTYPRSTPPPLPTPPAKPPPQHRAAFPRVVDAPFSEALRAVYGDAAAEVADGGSAAAEVADGGSARAIAASVGSKSQQQRLPHNNQARQGEAGVVRSERTDSQCDRHVSSAADDVDDGARTSSDALGTKAGAAGTAAAAAAGTASAASASASAGVFRRDGGDGWCVVKPGALSALLLAA
jgi:hypothetical protein